MLELSQSIFSEFAESKSVAFDPALHLDFDATTVRRSTISELGLNPSIALTDFAFTYPFKLLSEEGVQQARAELIKREVQQNCRFETRRNPYALRGMWKYSTFLNDLWKSQEMTDAVSQAAGYPLMLNPLDWELGHVNAQVDLTESSEFNPAYAITQNLEAMLPPEHVKSPAATFNRNFTTVNYSDKFAAESYQGYEDEQKFTDFWHVDDYPFVCIVMLSDPTQFEGGETVIRDNRGGIIELQFPGVGYAVIVQGRYVVHCARRAFNVKERIAMIPSYLPANPMVEDTTILDAAKGNSNLRELFQQWSLYRFERLSKRADGYAKRIADMSASGKFNKDEVMQACDSLIDYLEHTKEQLTWPDESRVTTR
ncbi:MAG: hypothetical protein VKJ24_06990 [Synechococcales bacterium]|nr:hypothetical protein [Synechococcales bacterium]